MNMFVTSQYQPRLSSIAKKYSKRISQSNCSIQIKLNYLILKLFRQCDIFCFSLYFHSWSFLNLHPLMLRSFSFFRVFESRAIIVQLYRQCQIYLEFGENISDSYNEMIHHSYPMICAWETFILAVFMLIFSDHLPHRASHINSLLVRITLYLPE